MNSRHVGVAAEAFAAARFARLDFDISVQYGANQPEYDLIVARGEKMLKVSVKGSQDGAWGLTQSYLKDANYQGAIDTWLARHGLRTVFCLIQFEGVAPGEMPRMYLARPAEIAAQLRVAAAGRGDTMLNENYTWGPRAAAAGTVDAVPEVWRFSQDRIETLLAEA